MARERYELAGKTVLITGAETGIGAATAREVERRGANVAAVGIQAEKLDQLAASLGNATAFECDVTDTDAVERAVAGAVERYGGIDVVMANAGLGIPGTFETQDMETFERTIEVNLLGVYRAVKLALPHLIERRGYVLMVASLAAAVHAPLMAAYSASKSGVEGLGNSLRTEAGRRGVHVGVAYFGYINTPMVRGAMQDPAAAQMRRIGPSILGSKDYPPEDAARAVADGIERRARKVVFPRWCRPILTFRTVIQPLVEMQARRDPKALEALDVADAAPEAELPESAPTPPA